MLENLKNGQNLLNSAKVVYCYFERFLEIGRNFYVNIFFQIYFSLNIRRQIIKKNTFLAKYMVYSRQK